MINFKSIFLSGFVLVCVLLMALMRSDVTGFAITGCVALLVVFSTCLVPWKREAVSGPGLYRFALGALGFSLVLCIVQLVVFPYFLGGRGSLNYPLQTLLGLVAGFSTLVLWKDA